MVKTKGAVISWSMYDFANNIFAMNVISLYFALWVTVDQGGEDIFYSLALAVSMVFTAISSPVLGAVSDSLRKRMPFLIFFTLLCVLFTTLVGVIDRLFWGLLFFGIANYCYQVSWVFYNALLPQVSGRGQVGMVSGYGKAFGYGGAIAGLLLVRPFVASGGRGAAFAPSAFFFLLFSLPCLLLIRDPQSAPPSPSLREAFRKGFDQLRQTVRRPGDDSGLLRFLAAAFFALNAVNTVIVFMAVYAHKVIGFSDGEITVFLVVSTVVAAGGCLGAGVATNRLGSKQAFALTLGLWLGALLLAALSSSKAVFWAVGPLAGIALGSTWVSGRALVVEITPSGKVGEAFGLFSLIGYSASVIGPLVWGAVISSFDFLGPDRYRLAVVTLLIFLICGLWLLRKVPRTKPV